MCADAGVLVLAVSDDALGYSFEIVEGTFDDLAFPDGFVQPVQSGLLRLVWLDGNSYAQEPISVVVKITAMSGIGRHVRAASASFHYALAARWTGRRAAAQLQRYATNSTSREKEA
jgi:hypothetical protein